MESADFVCDGEYHQYLGMGLIEFVNSPLMASISQILLKFIIFKYWHLFDGRSRGVIWALWLVHWGSVKRICQQTDFGHFNMILDIVDLVWWCGTSSAALLRSFEGIDCEIWLVFDRDINKKVHWQSDTNDAKRSSGQNTARKRCKINL